MKLKDVPRTATFAWDQSSSSSPLIATGAIAGALDESFSNESLLEIWSPDFSNRKSVRLGGDGKVGLKGSVTVGSRFNRIAWSSPNTNNASGVLATGMETGEVNVFDPEKITSGVSADSALIFKNDKHSGPVKGLDFNPIQKNLLLSGSIKAELFIHDINNPSNPIPPGATSTKLGEITSLQWNPTVSRVFAASSSSGYTSVWDLKAQKEIVSLQYGGGAAKGMDNVGGRVDLQMGKRRGMSDVCWHPEQATRLITASEDDESPIIMLWDLRNTRAPERILSGHHKGVLSVAWCKQDSDLLLSCGKDNRTLCWNPQTGEIVGELPTSNDWAFQTSWCPRNPDLLATASFDGHIGIHSLQTTHEPEQPERTFSETATADDIFGALGQEEQVEQSANVMSLTQTPKWLRRPVSATFGFGGLLASTSNLPGVNGKHQSGVVHLRHIVTESTIIDRAKELDAATGEKDKLETLCGRLAEGSGVSAWKNLHTLFTSTSNESLVQMLGFSKEDVERQVEEAIKKLPNSKDPDVFVMKASAKEEPQDGLETPTSLKPTATPSESSATSVSTRPIPEILDLNEGNLFEGETLGTPTGNGADFFSSMAASGMLKNPQLDSIVPKAEVAESSVGATMGSRASSVRSEVIRDNTFHIYPSNENDIDRLITQALVLGDFTSAVNLCLASERFADALLLAVRGGPELLQSTQKAYFARQTTSLPFLRVYQSIVTEDLADIVQNADLDEWKAIFAVICTFAKEGDFNNLADQLGTRLQYRWQVLAGSGDLDTSAAQAARENATLCFLAARRLEKVVGIWINEMVEEETSMKSATKYTAHAQALQTFIEKVAVFTAATNYVDVDLMTPTESVEVAESGARPYKLAALYDRFYEYADLLATQGMVDIAAKYVRMTPADYKGTGAAGSELDKARDRLLQAAGMAKVPASSASAFSASQRAAARPSASANIPSTPYAPVTTNSFSATTGYAASPSRPQPPQTQSYGYGDSSAYAPAQQSYGAPSQSPYAQTSQPPYQPTSTYGGSNGYGPVDPQPQGYSAPQSQYSQPPPPQPSLGPPPRANGPPQTGPSPSPVPAAQRRDVGGWNDAPNFAAPPKRPQSAARDIRPAAIMSPFPMSNEPMSPTQQFPPQGPPQGPPRGMTPPVPRGQPGMLPPPPKGGPRPPSAQQVARGQFDSMPQAGPPPSQARPTPPPQGPPRGAPGGRVGGPAPPGVIAGPPPGAVAGPPPGAIAGPPPTRALSPLGPPGRTPSQPMGGIRPPSSDTSRTMSPPSANQGARVGGPPPPGRRQSQTNTQPIQPIQSPGSSPAPSLPPTKPIHPSGDRSHIPPNSKPIYDTLLNELTRVKQSNLPAHLKRIVDDTERRLNILFDGLNNETVPEQAIDPMKSICKAISERDANTALALHVDLLTNSTGDMGSWTPGVKQLIRLGL